jgi:hypothetical protein
MNVALRVVRTVDAGPTHPENVCREKVSRKISRKRAAKNEAREWISAKTFVVRMSAVR